MAFSLRSLSEPTKARMGLHECVNHQLVEAFPVIGTRDEGASLARVQFTVLVMPSGPNKVVDLEKCGFSLDAFKTDKKVTDVELLALLATPIKEVKVRLLAVLLTQVYMCLLVIL